MLVNLEYPSNLFPPVETTPLPARTGHNRNVTYKRSPMLQMIRPRGLGNTRGPRVPLGGSPKSLCSSATACVCSESLNVPGRHTGTRRESPVVPGSTRLAYVIAIISCILITMTISAAPEQSAGAIAEIRSVLWAQQEAWNRSDIDGFMNGYARSKSTIFISEDTVRRGWETVRDRYREKYSDRAKMGVLTFSDLEIVLLSPDSAVAFGRWKLRRANDQPHGRFTLIFRLLSEGWLIVHDHTSAAPPLK
jgi:ketosteroid isomerase-like protein